MRLSHSRAVRLFYVLLRTYTCNDAAIAHILAARVTNTQKKHPKQRIEQQQQLFFCTFDLFFFFVFRVPCSGLIYTRLIYNLTPLITRLCYWELYLLRNFHSLSPSESGFRLKLDFKIAQTDENFVQNCRFQPSSILSRFNFTAVLQFSPTLE